ncbi:MAG: hypothetical protein N2444_00250 [Methylocystis sp.]|nr:hypothetical protein [Methylocystis sp.]
MQPEIEDLLEPSAAPDVGQIQQRLEAHVGAAAYADSEFTDWLARRLGTSKWVVARKSPRLAERHEIFLSNQDYSKLAEEFWKKTGKEPYSGCAAFRGGK